MSAPARLSPLLDKARKLVQAAPADLWPAFEPARIPLLIFDGVGTHLSGSEPGEPGWQEAEGGWCWPGRHPALVANTAVTLPGGAVAAGILADQFGDPPDLRRLAALLVHEAFHVFQHAHPAPAWEANELDALTYPRTNPAVAHARAEEAAALAAALAAGKSWEDTARAALAWRAERAAHLAPEHLHFERRLETVEGLAHFVETRFLDELPRLDGVADAGAGPREWAYRSGAALAHLLARGADGWQAGVTAGAGLDEGLRARLGASPLPSPAPELVRAARLAVEAERGRLAALLHAFREQPGPRLTLRAGRPLRVVGFDPLNVHALPDGTFLHGRYLRLSGPEVDLEVLGAGALARGPGPLEVTELEVEVPADPHPTLEGEGWRLAGGGLNVRAPREAVTAGGAQGWRIRL